MEEKFGIKGKIEYTLCDENGNVKDERAIGRTCCRPDE